VNFKLNNVFWTFQGEGYHAGRRALFLRLPYCNLKCTWCDTEFNSYKEYSEVDLLEIIKQEKSKFCVITGGEPTMNAQFKNLTFFMKTAGFEVAIESNGTFPIDREYVDFVTVSPKSFSVEKKMSAYFIHNDNSGRIDEFKYIVDENFDFNILIRHKDERARLSLSPEWIRWSENLNKIYNYIKENPEWRISLQTHKWMNIP